MAPKKTYRLRDSVPAEIQEELKAHEPLVQQLLFNRSILTEDDASVFLNPSYDAQLHDPFLLTDMEKAVERILSAIENKEKIIIYSDYDCDGIPGGVLLHDFFTAIEYTNFENYIPHRHNEGYGLSSEAVEKLGEKGANLIITVDCGITDAGPVKEANEKGIDVIITDHHESNGELPAAYAIVNPKRDDAYPFKGLSGTGVAYKLIQALLQKGKEKGVIDLKDGYEKWWLDMVGLATIADMVPLVDENRVLAHYGLHVLRKSRRPGLQKLLRKAGGDQRYITEDDIGFTIAPRINAASRMDDPEDAFHMLRTRDEGEAGTYVAHLEKLNNERKGIVAAMTKEAKQKLAELEEIPPVIVLGNPKWRPSLVGLVGNALSEEFKRPSFIWGRDGRGLLKGSCRTDGDTSVLELMEATPESFTQFGGHHYSGGFAVDEPKIHTLQDDLVTAFERLHEKHANEEHIIEVDFDLGVDDIDGELVRNLKSVAPYGESNPKPLFRLRDVRPERVETFGKTNNHTKLVFISKYGPREAVAFFKTPDQFGKEIAAGEPMTLIAHVEESHFRNRPQIRLRIVDIV